MKYINVNNFMDDLDEIVLAKIEIEKELIENGIIEKKFNINEFIQWIDFTKTIFMKNKGEYEINIPFAIHKMKSDTYIFYVLYDNNELNTKAFETFKDTLKLIKYDLSNLTPVNMIELFENEKYKPAEDFFIMNAKMYKI